MSTPSRSNQRFAFFLASRYLRGRRSRLLSGTARAALGSCALGVAAMVVATSLMNGYTETLVEKMMGGGAIIVAPTFSEAMAEGKPTMGVLDQVEGITQVRSALQGQGSLKTASSRSGADVYLRGATVGTGVLQAEAHQLAVQDGKPGAVLGVDLAERLGVEVGDIVDLWALDVGSLERSNSFRFKRFRVSGVFETGFWLFDREYAIIDSELVASLTGAPEFFEISIASADELDRIQGEVEQLLGADYLIHNWQSYNPDLFSALRLQKWGLFLLLGLIVVVSTFNVVSTLVVLVRERIQEIGVLTALGARPKTLRSVFVQCGLLLGLTGTGIGLAVGVVLCWIMTHYQVLSFDSGMAEIYFIDQVPFLVRWTDLVAIVGFAFVAMLLASHIPAARAARLSPADALRYE